MLGALPRISRVKEHSAVLLIGADVRARKVMRRFPGPISVSSPLAQDGSALTCL